jgi:hypothetical protein
MSVRNSAINTMLKNKNLFVLCSCSDCFIYQAMNYRNVKLVSANLFAKVLNQIDHGPITFHKYCSNETYSKLADSTYSAEDERKISKYLGNSDSFFRWEKYRLDGERQADLAGNSLDLILDDLPQEYKDFFIFNLDLFT